MELLYSVGGVHKNTHNITHNKRKTDGFYTVIDP